MFCGLVELGVLIFRSLTALKANNILMRSAYSSLYNAKDEKEPESMAYMCLLCFTEDS